MLTIVPLLLSEGQEKGDGVGVYKIRRGEDFKSF